MSSVVSCRVESGQTKLFFFRAFIVRTYFSLRIYQLFSPEYFFSWQNGYSLVQTKKERSWVSGRWPLADVRCASMNALALCSTR